MSVSRELWRLQTRFDAEIVGSGNHILVFELQYEGEKNLPAFGSKVFESVVFLCSLYLRLQIVKKRSNVSTTNIHTMVFWVLGCHVIGGYQLFKTHSFCICSCLHAEAAYSPEALVPRKPQYDSWLIFNVGEYYGKLLLVYEFFQLY